MTDSALQDIKACVFDAYGTLFDFEAIVGYRREALGDKTDALGALWRQKQLEYTWLRALMGRYEDFWQVTGDALDIAMTRLGIDDSLLRADLMQLCLDIDAFPDVAPVLTTLREAGFKIAILSNGSPTMLTAAIKSADVYELFDAVISVDQAKTYKPHPSVYQLAVDALRLGVPQIAFFTANGWDAAGAAAFGFPVVWLNRKGAPREALSPEPYAELGSLAEVPALFGL